VKDGPATLQVGVYGSVGDFPDGTLLLGAWKLGDGRLFGTFTEAKIPGVGTLPVCLVAGIEDEGFGFQGASFGDEHGKEFRKRSPPRKVRAVVAIQESGRREGAGCPCRCARMASVR
jgi:hypothetical protein